ncbi:hypothetical protein [Mesoterricola silvestris]|nr:hypothetical protein [Mesoterricola silvestris]
MNLACKLALCSCAAALISCQPVHVKTVTKTGINPDARTFIVGDDTWVEIKINSSGEQSVVSFENGTPDSLIHSVEDPFDILKWRIKSGKDGKLLTNKYVVTLAYKQSSKKIEVQLQSQLANTLSETMRVIVHLVPL